MSYRSKGAHARRSKNLRKSTPLGIEQLEARLLNSVDTIHDSLNQLLAPTAIVGSTLQTNTAPTVAAAISSTTGQSVQGKSVNVTVLGSDDGGEKNLKYTWSVLSAPTDGTVKFKTNGNNAGKANTLTFSRAGTYSIQVSIQDKNGLSTTSSMEFNVAQVLTTLQIKNGDLVLKSGAGIQNRGTTQGLQAIALDQFGQAMTTAPTFAWTITASPTGSNPQLSSSGNTATLTFGAAGTHTVQLSVGSISTQVSISVQQSLTQIQLFNGSQTRLNSGDTVETNSTNVLMNVKGVDQFGALMSSQPKLTWSLADGPSQGTARASTAAAGTTFVFNKIGTYSIQGVSGTFSTRFNVRVTPTLSSLTAVNGEGRAIAASGTTLSAAQSTIVVSGADQFGNSLSTQLSCSWSTVSTPTGGTATVNSNGSTAVVSFSKAGSYTLGVSVGSLSKTFSYTVVQVATSVSVTATSTSFAVGSSQQFRAVANDQFGQAMSTSNFTWTTTSGSISSSGLLTAGTSSGTFSVSAKIGSITGTLNYTLSALSPDSAIKSTSLASLVSTSYADGSISRLEMMQILRAAGNDGLVDSTELADLRLMVSNVSPYSMADYVRNLAGDVVNGNAANRTYKGQAAGNLTAGSSGTLLNNLVDKWFLGTDDPTVTGTGVAYRLVSGNLFTSTPSRFDAHQGMLGDCYFISALVSLADENPDAVRNMFVDNGDGTFTVRFYGGRIGSYVENGLISSGFASGSGTADYVTVSKYLPTYSNGMLAYSGYGSLSSNSANTLWIALAEKAYAQWNETGNEGRNGTNTYAGIEGGWMSYVYAQVLGRNATNYWFNNTTKETLINALNSGKAVTLGTVSSPNAGGLVGGHAYTVVSYNASTDTFALYNPWGTVHPSALTYAQLQANCSLFSVANPSGSTAFSTVRLRASVDEFVVGGWSPLPTSNLSLENSATPGQTSFDTDENTVPITLDCAVDEMSEWVTLERVTPSCASQDEEAAEESLDITDRVFADLARIESYLGSILES